MFTDTKNLANANMTNTIGCNDVTYSSTPKSRGKFCKVLKPLLRLITKSSPKCANIIHPNNVNLNNAASIKDIFELSTEMLEDYAAIIQKAAKDEQLQQQQELSFSCDSSAVISPATIEKMPMATCSGCSHGRNCQHEQYHNDYFKLNNSILKVEQPDVADVSDVPVHFTRTDSGTFFWTSVQEKIDDDLLNAWLCNSFRQFPTEAAVY